MSCTVVLAYLSDYGNPISLPREPVIWSLIVSLHNFNFLYRLIQELLIDSNFPRSKTYLNQLAGDLMFVLSPSLVQQ